MTELLFGGVLETGEVGMDGTGGQQQQRDHSALTQLPDATEGKASRAAAGQLGQCAGPFSRLGARVQQGRLNMELSRGRNCLGYSPDFNADRGCTGVGRDIYAHWQSVLGQQGGCAGACRQHSWPRMSSRKGDVIRAQADGPAIKGRNTPARLPPRFPAPGKCTSHLGFGLGPRLPPFLPPSASASIAGH